MVSDWLINRCNSVRFLLIQIECTHDTGILKLKLPWISDQEWHVKGSFKKHCFTKLSQIKNGLLCKHLHPGSRKAYFEVTSPLIFILTVFVSTFPLIFLLTVFVSTSPLIFLLTVFYCSALAERTLGATARLKKFQRRWKGRAWWRRWRRTGLKIFSDSPCRKYIC